MNTTEQAIKMSAKKPTLKKGDQGSEVAELQKLLKNLAVYRQDADGIFDVEFGVKLYQFRVFLPQDGIVGQKTWQALYTGAPVDMPVLKLGSKGEAVKTLQQVLQQTQNYLGGVDGDFNAVTDAAVRSFQKSVGVLADGVVGPQTWNALSQIPRAYNP
jgi:peptidoglycan hydrolase-like protein with peptidoglycan-binding domain